MSIVPGTQICVPTTRTFEAKCVIKKMESLLARRHSLQLSRRQFLYQWSKLRTTLFLTEEYQQLRVRTMARCKGRCTADGCKNIAEHCHHIKAVAWFPQMALVDSNVVGLCSACHRKEEKRVKEERLLQIYADRPTLAKPA